MSHEMGVLKCKLGDWNVLPSKTAWKFPQSNRGCMAWTIVQSLWRNHQRMKQNSVSEVCTLATQILGQSPIFQTLSNTERTARRPCECGFCGQRTKATDSSCQKGVIMGCDIVGERSREVFTNNTGFQGYRVRARQTEPDFAYMTPKVSSYYHGVPLNLTSCESQE